MMGIARGLRRCGRAGPLMKSPTIACAHSDQESNAGSLRRLRVLVRGAIAVAFLEVKRNLLQRALFPLFRFCQPKALAFGIQQSPPPADKFLFANFDQPVHELHSWGVNPIYQRTLAE